MSCNNDDKNNIKSIDNMLEEKLLEKREMFLWGSIDDESAEKIVKRILYLDSLEKKDIKLYVNSPGGVISSGLAIYDAMQASSSDVSTICMGQAASMGAVILCAGSKNKRYVWPNSRVMIHQPLISGSMFGPASDIEIQAEEMLRIKSTINNILAFHTGQDIKKIEKDTDRDFFLDCDESIKYGLVDKIYKG